LRRRPPASVPPRAGSTQLRDAVDVQ
jgi:hypothetical protein